MQNGFRLLGQAQTRSRQAPVRGRTLSPECRVGTREGGRGARTAHRYDRAFETPIRT